jgi:hypothetical protein
VTWVEKTVLAGRSGAIAVDMETFHLGEFFITRRVPFVGMRTVLDEVEDSLPPLGFGLRAGRRIDALDVLRQIFFGRRCCVRLCQLYRNGRRAQVSLRKSMAVVMRIWPRGVNNGSLHP